MSKGDWTRPCAIPKEEYEENFMSIFGEKKLNVMSDEDREALRKEMDDAQVPQGESPEPTGQTG